MRINSLSKIVLGCSMFYAVPVALFASANVDRQTNRSFLCDQIRSQAVSIENDAGQLQVVMRNPVSNDWEDDSNLLENVRDHVNKMNQLVSELRAQEAQASPSQQKAISEIVAPSIELAGTTQDAIVTLNHNQAEPRLTDLSGLENDIYHCASRVDQAVKNFHKSVTGS